MTTTAATLVADARRGVRALTPAQVEAHLLAQDATLVDVREPDEQVDQGVIAGSVHVPRGLLEFRADPTSRSHDPALEPDRTTIVYCAAGSRSALAVRTLETLGYRDVAHLAGGLAAWTASGLPVTGLASWHLAQTAPPARTGEVRP